MKIFFHIFILMIFVTFVVAKVKMAGGWSDTVKPYPESIKKYAKFATAEVSMSSNSPNHLQLIDISNVSKQVVAGMNYKMTLKMAPTQCKNKGHYNETEVDSCPLQACYTPTICNVTVWARPWLDGAEKQKMTKSFCKQGEKSTC